MSQALRERSHTKDKIPHKLSRQYQTLSRPKNPVIVSHRLQSPVNLLTRARAQNLAGYRHICQVVCDALKGQGNIAALEYTLNLLKCGERSTKTKKSRIKETLNLSTSVDEQMVARASKTTWVIRRMKALGVDRKTLVSFWKADGRVNLEMAAPVWSSSLTLMQKKSLEK